MAQKHTTIEFNNIEELETEINKLERVVEKSADIDGIPFGKYKSIVYKDTNTPATIVKTKYRVYQHPDALTKVLEKLNEENLEVQGYIRESEHGHISAKIIFTNPEYEVDEALGLDEVDTGCMKIGIVFDNTYGEPNMSMQIRAIGSDKNTTELYHFGHILGQTSVRHIGNISLKFSEIIKTITKNLPKLARYIDQAKDTKLDSKDDVEAVLRALDFGNRTTANLMDLNRKLLRASKDNPVNTWELYQTISRYISTKTTSEYNKDKQLQNSAKVLNPDRVPHLITKGNEIILQEQLEEQKKQIKDLSE